MAVIEVKHIPNSVYNRNQTCNALQRHPICLTNSDHDLTIDEIKRIDTIEYDGNMSSDEIYE